MSDHAVPQGPDANAKRFVTDAADASAEVGVGPWPGGPAAWPDDARLDPALLAEGDRRNVVDRFRYWSMEAIIEQLDRERHGFHVAVENWQHDFNIGSIVRSANAYGAAAVHIVGNKRWNRRGAMVTDRYQHIHHHPEVAGFVDRMRKAGLAIVAVDNVPGSVPIERTELPRDCVLVFGQEGPGVSPEILAAADMCVAITQYGSTRSINVGAAASATMFAWVLQNVHGWQVPSDETRTQ